MKPRMTAILLVCFTIIIAGITLVLFRAGRVQPRVTTHESGEWGSYELWVPANKQPRRLVFFFSDKGGFKKDDTDAAKKLTRLGAAVVFINTDVYLSRIDQSSDASEDLYLPGPVEWTSHFLQEELHFSEYKKPYLLGRGAGAGLVYALLVQGSSESFEGGLSVDFSPMIALKHPLSDHPPVSRTDSGQILDSSSKLCGWWHADSTKSPGPDETSFVRAASVANKGVLSEITVSASFSKLVLSTFKSVLKHEKNDEETGIESAIIEVSPSSTQKTLAIVYSGDGGWRDIDKVIGNYLSRKDIAVVGVNCLSYFWTKRTPGEVGRDLGWLVGHYLKQWNMNHVVLIGFSFGADILPPAYNRLPVDLQKKVVMITLLSPTRSTEYEFHISGWLSSGSSGTADLLEPEIMKIEKNKLQCFYGAEDSDETLCTLPCVKDTEIIRTSGGHHFDGNYEALGDRILSGLSVRLQKNNAGSVKK